MNILYITQDVPALDAGSLRHYHLLRRLGQTHAITLVSLVFRSELAADRIAALRPFVESLSVVPVAQAERRNGVLPTLKRKVRVKLTERRSVRELRRLVNEVTAAEKIDVIFLTSKLALSSVADIQHLPIVIDCCDAASIRAREAMRYARRGRRLQLALKWLRRRRVERRVAAFAPNLAFASARDQRVVLGSRRQSEIIPNGIDLEYWTRRSPLPAQDTILFFGALDYEPNHDAAVWLTSRIFPLIKQARPAATLEIVGRDPRPELYRVSDDQEGVTVTGRVEDIRPYIERAAVACIPLRIASGIQNKVLEALAMELPVVTTPPAAEGIRPPNVEEPPVLVGNCEVDLARSVLHLLGDPALRHRVAADGRAFVARNFNWDASATHVERMLHRAIQRSPARNAQTFDGSINGRDPVADLGDKIR